MGNKSYILFIWIIMYIKKIIFIVLFIILIANIGCVSYISAKASQREIATNIIIASHDQKVINSLNNGIKPEVAIKAIQLNNGGVGIGLDLYSLNTLTNHPVRQFAAAILDLMILYRIDKETQSGVLRNGSVTVSEAVRGGSNTPTPANNINLTIINNNIYCGNQINN